MPDITQLIQALPNLTQAELKTVKAAIDHLLKPDTSSSQELFDVTINVLGIKTIGYRQFAKTKAHQSWVNNLPILDDLVKQIVGTTVPDTQMIHLKRFLISLLIADLKAKQLEVTMPKIAWHLGNIQEVFENAFPSYLASGIANLVLKGLTK
jgi:hypothetical protein